MKQTLNELHHERGRLQERIAMQRHTLSAQLVPVANAFNLGDRLNQAASHAAREGRTLVRQYPLAVVAVVALVLVAKPKVFVRWTQRGLAVWRTWRSVRGMLPDFVLRQML